MSNTALNNSDRAYDPDRDILASNDACPGDGMADTSEWCLTPILAALDGGHTVDISTLIVNDNGSIELLDEGDARSCGFQFELHGVAVHAGIRTDGRNARMSISSDLGYLPYSIESSDKRRAIMAVMAAASDLKFSKFELVDNRHIVLRGQRKFPRPFQLIDMFAVLVEMIHELSPFMALLGDCMDNIQLDIPVTGRWQSMNPSTPELMLRHCSGGMRNLRADTGLGAPAG
ncbi:MAG: hypothetical protein AAF556_10945 [Pseudomonadota bacterium]